MDDSKQALEQMSRATSLHEFQAAHVSPALNCSLNAAELRIGLVCMHCPPACALFPLIAVNEAGKY